ncbi:hypothetical protein [Pseudonocardia alni]|uniref:Uncharacterized protein n=1 Tax=Pseudonocardia alni TaxID=33907 RepID=A0A852WF44_PSEA5|nr:hypothetical protein [Pseudonocardia antarctica]NYG03982.1 hypothetical protein [Pseudonocardia antarctica]
MTKNRQLVPMIGGAVPNLVNSSLTAVALVSGLYPATAVGRPVTGRLVER